MRKVCLGVLPLFILGVFILLVFNNQDTELSPTESDKKYYQKIPLHSAE